MIAPVYPSLVTGGRNGKKEQIVNSFAIRKELGVTIKIKVAPLWPLLPYNPKMFVKKTKSVFIIGHTLIPSTHITWLQTDPTTFTPGIRYNNAAQSAPVLKKKKQD